MIRPPKRAVTRFFIPLIDVLILLFCIFLLMPFVEKEAGSGKLSPGEAEALRLRVSDLEKKNANLERTREAPETLQQRIDELENELRESKRNAADLIFLRTFHIDPGNGNLTYQQTAPDGTRERIHLTSAAKSREVIDRDRASLAGTNKELVYLIIYPQVKSSFPTESQKKQYEEWFQGRVKARWEYQDSDSRGGK